MNAFANLLIALLDKATEKNSLSMLLARHVVTLGGGLLAGHGILTGDTKQIIFGVGFAVIVSVWSWLVRVLHLETQLAELASSDLVRSACAALASQAVTALSAALAVDANNPVLLVAAVINLVFSKLDLHQRLASLGSRSVLKVLIASLAVLTLTNCNSPLWQRVALNAASDAVAAGQGYLVAGKPGALSAALNQEAANIREWQRTAAKQPRKVEP